MDELQATGGSVAEAAIFDSASDVRRAFTEG
jgi:hypothetical protein